MRIFCLFLAVLMGACVRAQVRVPISSDTVRLRKDTVGEKDLIDVLGHPFRKDTAGYGKNGKLKAGRVHYTAIPAAGYTLHTRFAVTLGTNAVFYSDEKGLANLSVISINPTYTQNHQFIFPVISSIWTPGNKFNITGDWKYLKYPQYTYGLGGHSTKQDADMLDYSYISLRQNAARRVSHHLFLGLGYDFDYHFDIKERGVPGVPVSNFETYNQVTLTSGTSTRSSGISMNLLLDDRRNPLNPPRGSYANLVFRQNFTFLGSNHNWQYLLLDARKYFPLPHRSHNVLAVWSYTAITLGTVPYLDLPSTAWDTYFNTGRGYIQSRFRGSDFLYLESEYRFALTRNRLLGGVLFVNVQSVPEWPQNTFEAVYPGCGLGLRVLVNKRSGTNLAVDYGFGLNNSRGLFVNIGEVF